MLSPRPQAPWPRDLEHGIGPLQRLGLAAVALRDCLVLYLRVALGRERLDLPALAAAVRQSGLSVLPALTLISLAVGAILGAQTESFLGRFDLPGLVLLSVGYTVSVEIAPILAGILVAGRAGVALAVRQAAMLASEELDGLLVCGIDPVQFTLAPALLAMLIMSFAFAIWSALMAFTAAGVWLWAQAGVPPALFFDALRASFAPGDLLAAFLKPPVFALIIALIATVNGNLAGRDPLGASRAATRTMIGAVTAILLADLLFVLARQG
jgi:phospholipid/cholesterol/gamma-HCH transport system permease protein